MVLIHHPPASPRARRFKRLLDDRELRDTLARHGAELILHGHDHVPSLTWLARDRITGGGSVVEARIPVFGVPSASANPATAKAPAAYNLYRISGGAGAWRCEAVSRGIDRSGIWSRSRERQPALRSSPRDSELRGVNPCRGKQGGCSRDHSENEEAECASPPASAINSVGTPCRGHKGIFRQVPAHARPCGARHSA